MYVLEQMHEGDQDVPRADAIRFGRMGGPLRRARILLSSNTMATFRVYREYPDGAPIGAISPASKHSHDDPHPSLTDGIVGPGGYWVLEIGGKRMGLAALKADATQKRGLVFRTTSGEEIEATCEDKEAFRMWKGVAAVVSPAECRRE